MNPESNPSPVWPPFTSLEGGGERLHAVAASGSTLVLNDGRTLLDAISSWWTNLHGHGHPDLAAAVLRQISTLDHVIFAGFTHTPAETLARTLQEAAPVPFSRIFFSDNGSTAVEVALKLAFQYWRNCGTPRHRLLAFDGAYHGDTFGAMAAGARGLFTAPFESFLFEVERIPFPATWIGDSDVEETEREALEELDRHLERFGSEIAAFVAEPLVQGAAGMRMCRPSFLKAVEDRLKPFGILQIYDEVMTGFGRTGTIFATGQTGTTPHFLALSKGITGGVLPLGATLVSPAVEAAFKTADLSRTFFHGHSYAGNPIVCAAALASWRLLMDAGGAIRAITNLHTKTAERWSNEPGTGLCRPRSCGTILAVDLQKSTGYGTGVSQGLRQRFIERGVLLRPIGSTVYVMPPYCFTADQLETVYRAIEEEAALLADT